MNIRYPLNIPLGYFLEMLLICMVVYATHISGLFHTLATKQFIMGPKIYRILKQEETDVQISSGVKH